VKRKTKTKIIKSYTFFITFDYYNRHGLQIRAIGLSKRENESSNFIKKTYWKPNKL